MCKLKKPPFKFVSNNLILLDAADIIAPLNLSTYKSPCIFGYAGVLSAQALKRHDHLMQHDCIIVV